MYLYAHHIYSSYTFYAALPDRTFETIILSDAQSDSAMSFVRQHLRGEQEGRTLPGLDRAVAALGGRLTDLQLLVQKIHSGLDPDG